MTGRLTALPAAALLTLSAGSAAAQNSGAFRWSGRVPKGQAIEVKGINEGNATVTYHFHANVDQVSLWPTGETSVAIGSGVAVV